jgi:hypothetical protein
LWWADKATIAVDFGPEAERVVGKHLRADDEPPGGLLDRLRRLFRL